MSTQQETTSTLFNVLNGLRAAAGLAPLKNWKKSRTALEEQITALQTDPVAEAPVAEAPVAEAPVAEAPVAEAPVAEAPVTEETVVEELGGHLDTPWTLGAAQVFTSEVAADDRIGALLPKHSKDVQFQVIRVPATAFAPDSGVGGDWFTVFVVLDEESEINRLPLEADGVKVFPEIAAPEAPKAEEPEVNQPEAEKPATTAPAAKGEPSAWKDSWEKAPSLIAARVAKGLPAFREGTKRDILHKLLIEGVTLEAAMVATGWNKVTTQSGFYEISHLTGRSVGKIVEGEKPMIFKIV